MQLALNEAKLAFDKDEVPVGAILVKDGKVVAKAHNLREKTQQCASHAEILAIGAANSQFNSWRLVDCELYVTLEPCLMCAGAIQNARLKKVYYACKDPKAGALGSLYEIHKDTRLNHRFEVEVGTCEEEASFLLKSFFAQRRKK